MLIKQSNTDDTNSNKRKELFLVVRFTYFEKDSKNGKAI